MRSCCLTHIQLPYDFYDRMSDFESDTNGRDACQEEGFSPEISMLKDSTPITATNNTTSRRQLFVQSAPLTERPERNNDQQLRDQQLLILEEVRKTNLLLATRVDAMESRLNSFEQQSTIASSSSSVDSSATKAKKRIPTKVRVSCIFIS